MKLIIEFTDKGFEGEFVNNFCVEVESKEALYVYLDDFRKNRIKLIQEYEDACRQWVKGPRPTHPDNFIDCPLLKTITWNGLWYDSLEIYTQEEWFEKHRVEIGKVRARSAR